MSNDALDLAFARHVRQIGLVTPEQVAAALQTQARSQEAGTPISFSDALVQLGAISGAQREALQKKVKDQQAGVQQLGPYRLLKKIGEGGMGAVYLAEEPDAGRRVAVKILPRHLGTNAEFVKRFQREAQAAIRLKHPHIVGAFAAGEDLGFHYYVMEYCEGEALDALLKRERVLPVSRAITLVLQAARGLSFAHAQGIIHRDIKPSNIILTKDGTAKILDLGLSKRIDDASVSFKTVTGAVLGTPHYISPEQAQGEKGIDGRSDLYSLGATFYHLLTGKTPFEGSTILEVLHKQISTALPNPQDLREDIPDAVVRVLERMMAKKPADRYVDGPALIADLEEVQAGRTPKTQVLDADRTTIAPPLRRAAPRKRPPTVRRIATSRKNPALLVGGIAVAAALVLVVILLLPGRKEPSREDTTAAPRKAASPPVTATSPVSTEGGFAEAVARLPAEEQIRAVVAKLKEVNPGFDGPVVPVVESGRVTGLSITSPRLVRAWPLRALKDLKSLRIEGGGLEDLSPLRELRLTSLQLSATRVSDLSPLKGMPLRVLAVDRTAVQDLRGLEGLPLTALNVDSTGVSDLTPLKDVPLESLSIATTRVRDLSPLSGKRLMSLRCDLVLERDLPVLRSMPGLETVNDVPVATLFRKPEAAPALAPEAAWAEAVDLMPFIAGGDAAAGRWVREGAELRSEPGERLNVLALPYSPPDEYDFRIAFTPRGDIPDVNQILSRRGRAAQWLMGAYDNTVFGFGYVPGMDPRANPLNQKRERCLETGRRYVSTVQIRKDGLAGFLDGHLVCRLSTDFGNFELGELLVFPDRSRLGLVTFGNPTQFHAVEVREVSGKGRLLRSTPLPPPPLSPAEAQLRSALAKLKDLNPAFDGLEKHAVKDGVVTELSLSALGVTDLSPLAALKGLRVLDVSGRWDAAASRERRSALRDLSPLRGLPLVELSVHHAEVEDLSPLRGMKLVALDIQGTPVVDLAPLRGMPLRRLFIGYTRVSSLVPLAGAPLELLDLQGSGLIDLGPLKAFPLRILRAALDPKKDVKWLAGMATLEQINEMSAAEFLRLGGIALADPWKDAVDLLPLIDSARDVVRGVWKMEGGRLVSEPAENGVLRIPYEPPLEYDYRIAFTRTNGRCATALFLTREGKPFVLDLGGWGNVFTGFSDVAGVPGNQNPTRGPLTLRDGQRYVSVVQVRKDRVTALLDDRKVSEWTPSMGELRNQGDWSTGSPTMIGLGNCDTRTVFESLQVREISGKGRTRLAQTTPPDAAFLRAVTTLPAAEQLRRVLAKLAELNPGFDVSRATSRLEGGKVADLALSAPRLIDLWPLRGIPSLRKLDLGDAREKSQLSDLSALKGLPLRDLGLANTRVTDLSPLQGMPLTHLRIQGTLVKELSPLRGMPLKTLDVRDSAVTDFTPLNDLKAIETINDMPARNFLKAGGAPWKPLFDGRTAACLRATESWRFENGALVNVPGGKDAAQTRFEIGDGELRIRFEPLQLDGLFFKVRQNEQGGYSLFIDTAQLNALEGRAHDVVFSCRGDQVSATLDGRPFPLSDVKRAQSGCLQFMAEGKSLRITGIDVRD